MVVLVVEPLLLEVLADGVEDIDAVATDASTIVESLESCDEGEREPLPDDQLGLDWLYDEPQAFRFTYELPELESAAPAGIFGVDGSDVVEEADADIGAAVAASMGS